jgi:hypothetical protein
MSTQELFENPNEKPNKKGKKIYTAEEKKGDGRKNESW